MGRHDGVPDVLLDARTRRGGAGLWEIHGGAPTPPNSTASAPPALRAGSASGGRGLSCGACGAFAPLAGLRPAPPASQAGAAKPPPPTGNKRTPPHELSLAGDRKSTPLNPRHHPNP